MKLFLFGGAYIGKARIECKLIEKEIKRLKPKQILHIPFARTIASEADWAGDWFHRYIHLHGTQYLNAKNKSDIRKARSPLIFISGGSNHHNLITKVKNNTHLMRLIKNAHYLIGESAGSAFVCQYFWARDAKGKRRILSGLNILKQSIILPHYTERNYRPQLTQLIHRKKIKHGLGIDTETALVCDTKTYPKRLKKIGNGRVEMLQYNT